MYFLDYDFDLPAGVRCLAGGGEGGREMVEMGRKSVASLPPPSDDAIIFFFTLLGWCATLLCYYRV